MESKQPKIRIHLTPEQRNRIRAVTGEDTEVLELTVEELEERISPAKVPGLNKYSNITLKSGLG
jgi:hypothetical protein